MKKVLHFVRKKSQLKASFIQNQIVIHNDFEPVVIFRQDVLKEAYDGGFAQEIASDIKVIDLGDDETLFEKTLFRFGKQLSLRQCKKLRKLVLLSGPLKLNTSVKEWWYQVYSEITFQLSKSRSKPNPTLKAGLYL